MLRVIGFSLYGPLAASHRVRLSHYQSGLAANGIKLEIQSLLDDGYLQRRFAALRVPLLVLLMAYWRRIRALNQSDSFDIGIVHCELLPFLPGWLERQLLKIPFVYDCDDAFYLRYRYGRFRWLQPLLGSKIECMMASAVAVTAGNADLVAYAQRFNNNVILLPSVVDTDQMQPASCGPSQLQEQPFTVGWIGSPSTAPYLKQLVAPLQDLALERRVRLLVVGGPAPSIPGVEVIEQPWSMEQELPLIQQFDVGVMPLPDTLWSRGKCAYKLIQCMSCAIPVIASPVGANLDAVPPTCGILAYSADQWLAAFQQLAADPELRQRMGAVGRQWVEEHYSLRSALPALAAVIRRAAVIPQV